MAGNREQSHQKHWTIIGAGPIGSMQAAVFATLFPHQKIVMLDQRAEDTRGHGLVIWKDTINTVNAQLNEIKRQLRNSTRPDKHTIIQNIDKTTAFLKTLIGGGYFSGPSIKTGKISELLREHARRLLRPGLFECHLKTPVEPEDLIALLPEKEQVKIRQKLAENKAESNAADHEQKHQATQTRANVPEILKDSAVIIGADGSHSRVRAIIFGQLDEDVSRENVAHLLEIKLKVKHKPNPSIIEQSLSLSGHVKRGNYKTGNTTHDNEATLHVFISKKDYEKIRRNDMVGGQKIERGQYKHPYRRLIEIPKDIQPKIEEILISYFSKDGEENFEADTVKITAIPMDVSKAPQLVKYTEKRLFTLVGDAAVGLVIVRGVNNGIKCAGEYGKAFFECVDPITHELQLRNFLERQDEIEEGVDNDVPYPSPLHNCETRINEIAKQSIKDIKWEVGFIPSKEFSQLPDTETSAQLKRLKLAISQLKYGHSEFSKQAELLLALDRLYIRLNQAYHDDVRPLSQEHLNNLVDEIIKFYNAISDEKIPANEKFVTHYVHFISQIEKFNRLNGEGFSKKVYHKANVVAEKAIDLVFKSLKNNSHPQQANGAAAPSSQPLQEEKAESASRVLNLNPHFLALNNLFELIQSTPTKESFTEANLILCKEILVDFAKQEARGVSSTDILNSEAGKYLLVTTEMLRKLKETQGPGREPQIQIMKEYEEACDLSTCTSKFAKAISLVIFAAIGFAAGAVVGGLIGLHFGLWTGPGAVVTAATGITKGAFTGKALGLKVGSALLGLKVAYHGNHRFFGPSKLKQAVENISCAAGNYGDVRHGPT